MRKMGSDTSSIDDICRTCTNDGIHLKYLTGESLFTTALSALQKLTTLDIKTEKHPKANYKSIGLHFVHGCRAPLPSPHLLRHFGASRIARLRTFGLSVDGTDNDICSPHSQNRDAAPVYHQTTVMVDWSSLQCCLGLLHIVFYK